MTKYFTTIAIILSAFVLVQGKEKEKEQYLFVKDETSGSYYYEEIVPAPGLKKEVIYDRAKKWIIANLKTADNNISADDVAFTLVNSAAQKVDREVFINMSILEGQFDFKLHISAKDDKFRIRVDNVTYNLMVKAPSNGTMSVAPRNYIYSELDDKKLGRYLKRQASDKTTALLTILKKSIIEGTESKKDSEW